MVTGGMSHILVDTLGLLIGTIVRAADVQDCLGTPRPLREIRSAFPSLRHVIADSACARGKCESALAGLRHRVVEIVQRSTPPRASCCCRGAGW
jgi:hypothetical protein